MLILSEHAAALLLMRCVCEYISAEQHCASILEGRSVKFTASYLILDIICLMFGMRPKMLYGCSLNLLILIFRRKNKLYFVNKVIC
jgi:hypothetical protein